MPKNVAVLIPAYQAEAFLAQTIRSVLEVGFEPGQVIVVDDGSTDRTSEVARGLGVDVLRHEKNRGKGAAHQTGFARVRARGFDACVTMDADGQHAASEISHFLGSYRKGNHLVVGSRMANLAGMPFDRFMTNKLTSITISLLGRARVEDSQCGFRLIDRKVLERVKLRTNRYDTECEILFQAARRGFRISSAPVSTIYTDTPSFINPVIDAYRFLRFAVRSLWL